jgi:CIC family chloride channel protein
MGSYIILGLVCGLLAPWFLRSLRVAETFFLGLRLPLPARLSAGGLGVGLLAIHVPEVCGNGYTVVGSILRGEFVWGALLVILVCKWIATASSVGSGAPGGVFTPSLFMGASTGFLVGTAVHAVWPAGAADPRTFALVGMGAFLSAASHAPVMAIIIIFEMTLSYDIILPLMLSSVVAYFMAKSIEGRSLYSEALSKKAAAAPLESVLLRNNVATLMRRDPPTLPLHSSFSEIARLFLSHRVNHLYVVDQAGCFLGAISLHDIKPFLQQAELARIVLASDIIHDNFPRLRPEQNLSECLGQFSGVNAERLPVVDGAGRLIGSLSKGDLLLALSEQRTANPAAA